MRRPVPDLQELRSNLAEIYSLIQQQQRILFRTQAVAEALLETLRQSQIRDFDESFEKHFQSALSGRIAAAQELALSSLDTLIGRLSANAAAIESE
jgi:hypothetical protein